MAAAWSQTSAIITMVVLTDKIKQVPIFVTAYKLNLVSNQSI
jgi:hypothetical protein